MSGFFHPFIAQGDAPLASPAKLWQVRSPE